MTISFITDYAICSRVAPVTLIDPATEYRHIRFTLAEKPIAGTGDVSR